MAHQQHYESPFGDTTLTKVFVGGLAWETPTDLMRNYFEQFGEILEAVIINDKATGKSKGYGFVTFRDPESANRACADPNPVIGGRRANCNVASLGRTRPSPPRGRNRMGDSYQGASRPSYRPSPPPLPSSAFGYAAYPPDYGYHHQQTQYYNHLYGAPYYYGYSVQAPRGTTFSMPPAQQLHGPSYVYYPSTPSYAPPPPRLSIPSSSGAGAPASSSETEAGPATSTSSTA